MEDHYIQISTDEEDYRKPTKAGSLSIGGVIMTLLISIILLPFTFLMPLWGSLFLVNPKEEKIVLFWGKVYKVYREPGVKWYSYDRILY